MSISRLARRIARTALQAAIAGSLAVAGWRQPPVKGPPRSILLIRLDLLGDVLHSLHAAEGLRAAYPDAHLAMMTLPYTAPLARLSPSLDEVIELDTNRPRTLAGLLDSRTWRQYWRLLRRVRAQRYDLAISLCGRTASLCAFLSGATRVIGYRDEAYPGALTDPVEGGRYEHRRLEVDYIRHLAHAAGAVDFPVELQLPLPESARQQVTALLQARGVEPHERVIVIHAGAINGSAKRWPAENWGAFVRQVQDAVECRIVLAGAVADRPIARQVVAAGPPGIIDLVGETDLETLLVLLARADLVASGDSGPLHLAAALGRPLLAVYGPTDPRVHGPFAPRAGLELLRRDLPCSPCYSLAAMAECPLGDPICMRSITVPQMVAGALRLLAGPRQSASA